MLGDITFVVIALVVFLRFAVSGEMSRKTRIFALIISGILLIGVALRAGANLPGNALGIRLYESYQIIIKAAILALIVFLIFRAWSYVKNRELQKQAKQYSQENKWDELDRELEAAEYKTPFSDNMEIKENTLFSDNVDIKEG